MGWSPLYLRTRTGFLVRISRRTEARIYERMFVEDMFPLAAIQWREFPQRPVVFDVGACFGNFALSAMDRHPDAQVHLFEANPHLLPVIEHHRDINGCANWTINHGAVGDSSQPIELHLSSTPLVASLNAAKAHAHHAKGTVRVPGIRLDDYVAAKSIARIAIMKLDVEGCEEHIIRHSPATFDRVEALFIRLFPGFSDLSRVQELLRHHNLRLAAAAVHHHNEYLFLRSSESRID
jgi:FkbM family methyltransferase